MLSKIARGKQLDTSTSFFIILDGSVDIKVTVAGGTTQEFTLVSGEFIDTYFGKY